MKKVMIFIVTSLLLIGLVCAQENMTNENDTQGNGASYSDDVEYACEEWSCDPWSTCINNIKTRTCTPTNNNCSEEQSTPKTTQKCTEGERLNPSDKTTDCPENCFCTGSVTRCFFANGTREMIITGGKSGNIIVQVKGMNASTTNTLYRSGDGELYTVNKHNETKRIRLLPDQVREKVRAKFSRNFDNESIILNEDGTYTYVGEKKAKLFFLFPVKSDVTVKFDSETGKLIQVRNPWWAFMSKDENADTIVGASCGTVTPGENDNCCRNKSFDVWNATTRECQFSNN
jgi:hypothetical protein